MEHDQEWARAILELDSVMDRLRNHGYHATAIAYALAAQDNDATLSSVRAMIVEGGKVLEAITK